MNRFRGLDELEVAGKRVLVRLDLNVPMIDGRISDATRIERSLATVADLSARGARVVLLSHFGRPRGRRDDALSLLPIGQALAERIEGHDVHFADDCIGPEAAAVIAELQDGDIALLENLRFHAGEEANDPAFAAELAALGDCYVNDAFSCAHRAHASTAALAGLLPAAAGRNMQAELEALGQALDRPERPLLAIVGGAKVSTKLAVLGHLIARVDALVIGGGMANTFLRAAGYDVGASLCEHDLLASAREIAKAAEAADCEIVLPSDIVIARALRPNADTASIVIEKMPAEMMILDLGPRTVLEIEARIRAARTLVWNGPLGAFETPPFDAATNRAAAAAAAASAAGTLVSVAGGGDTVAALANAGVLGAFSYVSTAGGAFLEWLEGKTLPGVAALDTDTR